MEIGIFSVIQIRGRGIGTKIFDVYVHWRILEQFITYHQLTPKNVFLVFCTSSTIKFRKIMIKAKQISILKWNGAPLQIGISDLDRTCFGWYTFYKNWFTFDLILACGWIIELLYQWHPIVTFSNVWITSKEKEVVCIFN